MYKIIKNSWALFTGFTIIIISHGFQGNLLGIRSVIENFNFIATGTMMSGYFVGFFVGANVIPNLVSKVGHVRVFAAFASMASLSSLVHVVFVDPIVWVIARFLTGFSMIGIFVIVESWLNDRATNKNRGQLLSAYMMVIYFGLAVGMLLLNVSKPEDYEPFILVSILLSVALVPILLTKRPAPKFKKIETISINELFKISPLGTLSSFFTGIIHAAFFSLISVYATLAKFTLFETSILLFIATIAGVIGQGPIGYFSDTFDRRKVIVITTFGSSILAFISILTSNDPIQNIYYMDEFSFKKIIFFISVGLYSSLCLPLFSLNLAHTNDFVPKSKFVAAGGGLQFIFGVGAISGPILCSLFMEWFGINGLFIFLIIAHAIIGGFGLYRMKVRGTVENPDSTFTPVPATITPAGLELDPDTPATLDENQVNDATKI